MIVLKRIQNLLYKYFAHLHPIIYEQKREKQPLRINENDITSMMTSQKTKNGFKVLVMDGG